MEESFIFVPGLECKRGHRGSDLVCAPIILPYPNLKAMTWEDIPEEGIHLPDWPPDGWSTLFGCSECGFVSEYFSLDVEWGLIPKSAPGRFHSGADCFCIEFRCGQRNCKAPTKLHVQRSGLTESAVRDLLRRPFFIGSLPCGHDVPSLPAREYSVRKIMDPIE